MKERTRVELMWREDPLQLSQSSQTQTLLQSCLGKRNLQNVISQSGKRLKRAGYRRRQASLDCKFKYFHESSQLKLILQKVYFS